MLAAAKDLLAAPSSIGLPSTPLRDEASVFGEGGKRAPCRAASPASVVLPSEVPPTSPGAGSAAAAEGAHDAFVAAAAAGALCVLQCAQCLSILGDAPSAALAAGPPACRVLGAVAVEAQAGVRRTPALHTSLADADYGSTYHVLVCAECGASVGRAYRTTAPEMDLLRGRHTLSCSSLRVHPLSVGGGRANVERDCDEPAAEPKDKPTNGDAPSRRLDALEAEVAKVQRFCMFLFDRVLPPVGEAPADAQTHVAAPRGRPRRGPRSALAPLLEDVPRRPGVRAPSPASSARLPHLESTRMSESSAGDSGADRADSPLPGASVSGDDDFEPPAVAAPAPPSAAPRRPAKRGGRRSRVRLDADGNVLPPRKYVRKTDEFGNPLPRRPRGRPPNAARLPLPDPSAS